MARNRKYFVNKSVILVTARTEEGLPFVPTDVMNHLLNGILARGQTLYPVRICHYVFMANHFHMIIVVDTPEDVSSFIGYLKGESSHAVNKLLGRRKKTIWASGYDSPVLLTEQDVRRYIKYIYLNPSKANLVKSIDHYPGISSWKQFNSGIAKIKHRYYPRSKIRKLPFASMSVNEQKKYVKRFQSKDYAEFELHLEPFAWMECFEENK